MNQLFDEDTVTIAANDPTPASSQPAKSVRLSNANMLKNHARYSMAQQQGQLFDNSILRVSSDLLSLIISVKRMQCPTDLYTFRSGIKHAITELKYRIAALDYPPSVADKTCFLFAVMIDEQILHSSWGDEAGWENQTLVSELFNIKNGGEQFYIIAERALLQPVLLVDLLELIYIMLKMGFRGRYRTKGKDQLTALMKRLEEAVFAKPVAYSAAERLAPVAADDVAARHAKRPKKPVGVWRSVALFVVMSALVWGGLRYWYEATSPQKALPFTQLTQYTQTYYSKGSVQDKEYVYDSTPSDMKSEGWHPTTTSVNSAAEPATSTVSDKSAANRQWLVQLASFNNPSDAAKFIARYKSRVPSAQVKAANGRYRVVSENFATKSAATETLSTAKSAGISDAFLLIDTN
ncbi:type IVB secretion system protein IcmH/DotU [Vibrio fluvialis]|nr:type IVB secretion system protein IcmH/DotU [Vibrio fluvialis]